MSLFQRLKAGLTKTAQSITQGIGAIFTKRKLDQEALDELEEVLIRADLGLSFTDHVIGEIRRTRFDKECTPEEIRGALADEVAKLLRPWAKPLAMDTHKPHVVLVVGVNGSGKTTTIGKIAHQLKGQGKSVLLAAGDTFRAAAIEQLQVWGERIGAPVIARAVGSDAAGLAYDAVEQAKREGRDIVLIDTAGRLQNKANLMAELDKVIRVIRKIEPTAPHSVLLVLDATTGQNAITQVEVFKQVAAVTGLVITKLDGTARGGVLVPIVEKHGLPIHFIGVGEKAEDLQPFDADAFARALAGAD